MGGILDHDGAVDDHGGARAAGVLVRIGIGGAVAEIIWIEDRHVGAKAQPQQAAIPELERASGRAGHLVDGALQRQNRQVADITIDDARKSAKWLELLKEIAPNVTRAGGPSGSRHSRWDGPVRRPPVRSAVVRGGIESRQRALSRHESDLPRQSAIWLLSGAKRTSASDCLTVAIYAGRAPSSPRR